MKLLLDTHIAFWLMFEPDRLSRAEQAVVGNPGAALTVSVVSLWELRIKWNRRFTSGARKGPAEPGALLAALEQASIATIDLQPRECAAQLDPPLSHTDPFDELLLTQAQQGGYRLLTRDEKLAAHPVALVAA